MKVAADLVNAVGEGVNNALALTGSAPLLKIPAPGSSADTNGGGVVGSPDKVVDLNAVGDGIDNSLSALNPFGTDQGNKQAGTDGQNSGPQTPLGRRTKLTPKSLTDGFKFTPLKPRSSKGDNQTGGPVAKVGANIGDSLQQVGKNVEKTIKKATDSVTKGFSGFNGHNSRQQRLTTSEVACASHDVPTHQKPVRRRCAGAHLFTAHPRRVAVRAVQTTARWRSPRCAGQMESRRERRTIGKVAVHGGAGDSQHLRDVGGRDALLPELAGFGGIGVVDLAGASALAPVGCGGGQPGAGALDHGVAFELGERGHDGEHGRAHRPVGVQTFGEAAESDPSGRQLVHHRENVLGVASEAVEFPDGEHVAFAEMVEAGIEMGSARGRAAHAMVGVDAGRPGFLKRIELKLGILVGGADSRVPDDGQPLLLSHNPVELLVLILRL